MLEENFDIMTTEHKPETYDYERTLPIPVPLSQAQSVIEEELDKYNAKLHFPEYNQCTIVANEGKSTYKMIIYMYDAATGNTQCVGSNLKPLVKEPVDEYTIFDKDLPAEKVVSDDGRRTVSDDSAKIQAMKYSEAIILTIDIKGDQMTKISSLFHTSSGYNFGGYQYNRRSKIVYSTLMPQPCLKFTNKLGKDDPAVKALQQAAHSRFGLVLRNEVNSSICNGSKYFFYYKDNRFGGIPEKYKGERCVFTFNGFSRSADPTIPQGGDRPYLDNAQVWMYKDGAWKFYTNTSALYYAGSLKEEDYVQCYTNGQLLADYYSYPTQLNYFHIKPSFKSYPYEIGDIGYTDKDCEGKPVEPGTTPQFDDRFPFEEVFYLKYGFSQTKDLEECITFTAFEDKGDGGRSFYLRGHEGKYLPYKKEEGCWHQYPLRPDSEIFNIVYKTNPVTNNKQLYDFIMKKQEFEGKAKYNEGFPKVEYESQFWSSSKGLYYIKFQEKSETGDTIVIAFNRAEGTVVKEIRGGWRLVHKADWRTEWKPEFDPKLWPAEYKLTQGKDYYRGFRTNHKLLFTQLKRENMLNDAAQFISPCTDPTPDGQLPPGIAGPDRPPKPKPPGAGGNDPIGPKPNQPGDTGAMTESNISECFGGFDDVNTRVNGRINGLYYYYLEESLFQTGGDRDNTTVLGTTNAIANIAYAPFVNLNPGHLCKAEFDVKRFGSIEGKVNAPWVFRIKSTKPVPMDIARWNVYPKNRQPAGHARVPWKWSHESRLLDYPYRKVAFFSNIFDMYDVIPHLHYQSTGDLEMTLKACCPVTPGGNFYLYVDNYKGDSSGFIERQFTSTSMDIPNTSSAYSTYMATQKSQAANQIGIQPLLKTTGTIGGAAIGALVGSVVPGAGTAAGAAAGAVIGGGISMAGAIMDNMAKRADLMTTPKSLSSMGGDVIARLGDATKATVVSCDMEITDQYKDLLARYFHMFGTKQNRVLDVDSNINSRYYFNYIQTVGCNISANGVPKRHIAKIKAVMDRGTTFWHLDREGVTFGEYCVYDNVEI